MRNKRKALAGKQAKSPRRRSFGGRLLRWIGIAALGWVVLTAVPVLLMRWLHPTTSAFMLAARAEALASGDFRYRNRYEWVDFGRISPNAALAVIASEDQLFPF